MALQPEQRVTFRVNEDDGRVVLLAPRFRSGPLARWLQPRLRRERAHFRVNLEERGSWIWQQCDGQRLVGQITAEFREAFPQETQEVEERVCMFLYNMADNGFVDFKNLAQVRERAESDAT